MLPLRLAVRFLKSGGGQTILVILGIGVAFSAQIFVGLLINSLQKTLIDRTVGHSPHITITSATYIPSIRDWENLITSIDQTGLVKVTAATNSGNATIEKDNKVVPVLFRGLDTDADKIYHFSSTIYQGSWNPSSRNEVLVGKELQDDLQFHLGENLVVQTSYGSLQSFKISGFYDLGIASLNKTWIIINVSTAQALLGQGNRVSAIEIAVEDLFQADKIANQLKVELNKSDLKIDNWKDQNQDLLSGLQGQSISSLMIQIFIVVSVVIAIASILAITVFQKSRQIGILKAMGIKDRSASLIFIFEGLLIGFVGSVGGVLLGLGLFYGFAVGTAKPGQPVLIELIIDYRFIAISWIIAVLAAVVAALIPARRSLRLNPIDVIREG
jgi:lipoprotein-releasing system permease protein